MSKEMFELYVAITYAKRVGFSELPPPNPDGSVPYEEIAAWFDRVCYYALEDPSAHAERFTLQLKQIDDMPEDAQ